MLPGPFVDFQEPPVPAVWFNTVGDFVEQFPVLLASPAGGAEVGVDDGQSGALFTTLQAYVEYLAASTGAGQIGFDENATYPVGSVGAYLQGVVNGLHPTIDPHVAPWNADNTGVEDVTAIFNTCYSLARTLGVPVEPSGGKYKFLGSLDPAHTMTRGPGGYSRETTVYTDYGVVFLHAGSVPLFSPSAGGFTLQGIIIFDPNQLGAGVLPDLTRPPVISATPPARLIDIYLNEVVVVNCLDFLQIPVGSLGGNIHLTDCEIYAIRYLFWLLDGVPESIFITSCIFTPGTFQHAAIVTNGAMLAKWSEANGIHFAVDLQNFTQYGRFDGLASSNNLYFGNYAWMSVVSGAVDIAASTGDKFDNMNRVLGVYNDAEVYQMSITGASVYSVSNRLGNTVRTRAFEFDTTGQVNVNVSGGTLRYCAGDWIIDTSVPAGDNRVDFSINAVVKVWGQMTGLVGAAYFLRTSNAKGLYRISCPTVNNRGGILTAQGVSIVDAEEVTINGTSFYGTESSIVVEASTSSAAVINVTSCVGRDTIGPNSFSNLSGANVYDCGSRWDKATNVTPSV